jgi:hypothetical protein
VLDALDDGRRRFCVGRWLGMRALGENPPATIDLGGSTAGGRLAEEAAAQADYKAAKRSVELITNGALERGGEESMSAFLDRLVATVRIAGTSLGLANHADALENVSSAYLAAPEDPFRVQFEVACDLAVWLYGHLGLPVDPHSVRYEMAVTKAGIPHELSHCPAVDGGCRVNGPRVVAGIRLTGERFWCAEMCAIPYVLLHELVVHAFAAPHAIKNGDGFADGWMDYIAFDLHRELTSRRLPERSPLSDTLSSGQQYYQAELLHAARATGRAVIKDSKIAATQAHDALRRAATESEARIMLWGLSVALNRSDMESTLRAEACEQLGRALAQDGTDVQTEAETALREAAAAVRSAPGPSERIELSEAFAMRLLDG